MSSDPTTTTHPATRMPSTATRPTITAMITGTTIMPTPRTTGADRSPAWGAGVLGVGLGIVTTACFVLATG